MKFPDELLIRAVDAKTAEAIPRLALKLIIFAPKKNNYTIPAVSDDAGEVRLSADYVRQSIRDDWQLFPMDYASPLEECSAEVELRVCSPEDVQRAVEAMTLFSSASTISGSLIDSFKTSSNARYFSNAIRFNVETSNSVKVPVTSR